MTVVKGHDPKWPDKLVFATLLLIIAGLLGTLYGLIMLTGATIGGNIPAFFRGYPSWLSLVGSLVALATGIVGFRHQTSKVCWVGAAGAVASMAFFGIVPALAGIAVVMLVLSLLEGEETTLDAQRMEAHEWPDKAMMAAAFLTVGAVAGLGQGILLFVKSSYAPFLWAETPWIWGSISTAAGVLMVIGAVQCFRLREPWTGLAGAVAGIAALAFWVLGPVLGVLALIMIGLAHREGEFLLHRSGGAHEAAGAET